MRAATPWNAFERSISRPGIQKDASVTCFGLDGPISGFRADLVIADDLCDTNNSGTATQREKLAHTFMTQEDFSGALPVIHPAAA
jgi:hypothetical protein